MTTNNFALGATGNSPSLERVRYFPGQLVTPDDLIQEQNHQRARMRRHNRLLHGWGVICGAWVDPKLGSDGKRTSEVIIQPGAILGPYGDEIIIDPAVVVDVLSEDLEGNAVPCGGVVDPWCANVRVDRPPDQTLYLAVKYAECLTRPVRAAVGGCGCGCGDKDCEYSRIRDSFVVKILAELPKSHEEQTQDPPPLDGMLFCGEPQRPCPSCPGDPWVVLADITLDNDAGTAAVFVNNIAHRRYVAAFGTYSFKCETAG